MEKLLSNTDIKREVDNVIATMAFEGFIMTDEEKASIARIISGKTTAEKEIKIAKEQYGWNKK
jgi:hypothetical protein